MVLRSFSDKFPHVHIKLIIRTPAEQLNGVLNNHIDLAIGSYNSQVHNIISEPLYREQHWLYCSDLHPMFFSRQLDKEQISQCPLVTRSYWNTSDLRRRGFSKGSATVETVDAQLLLILSGKYIAICRSITPGRGSKRTACGCCCPTSLAFSRRSRPSVSAGAAMSPT